MHRPCPGTGGTTRYQDANGSSGQQVRGIQQAAAVDHPLSSKPITAPPVMNGNDQHKGKAGCSQPVHAALMDGKRVQYDPGQCDRTSINGSSHFRNRVVSLQFGRVSASRYRQSHTQQAIADGHMPEMEWYRSEARRVRGLTQHGCCGECDDCKEGCARLAQRYESATVRQQSRPQFIAAELGVKSRSITRRCNVSDPVQGPYGFSLIEENRMGASVFFAPSRDVICRRCSSDGCDRSQAVRGVLGVKCLTAGHQLGMRFR